VSEFFNSLTIVYWLPSIEIHQHQGYQSRSSSERFRWSERAYWSLW